MNWSAIILLAIHLGVAEVLQLFPNLPAWLQSILAALAGAQAEAKKLSGVAQKAALLEAREQAALAVHKHYAGVK